jgi:predicted N-formylglutamate amidohydrolase
MRKVLQSAGKKVADNFPYDLTLVQPGSIHIHSKKDDLPILAVEISIDTINTAEDEKAWAEILTEGLAL